VSLTVVEGVSEEKHQDSFVCSEENQPIWTMDTDSGKPFWSFQTGASVRSNPMSFGDKGR